MSKLNYIPERKLFKLGIIHSPGGHYISLHIPPNMIKTELDETLCLIDIATSQLISFVVNLCHQLLHTE